MYYEDAYDKIISAGCSAAGVWPTNEFLDLLGNFSTNDKISFLVSFKQSDANIYDPYLEWDDSAGVITYRDKKEAADAVWYNLDAESEYGEMGFVIEQSLQVMGGNDSLFPDTPLYTAIEYLENRY